VVSGAGLTSFALIGRITAMQRRITDVLQRLFGLLLLAWVLMGLGAIPWERPAVDAAAEPLREAIFGSGYLIPVVLFVPNALLLWRCRDSYAPILRS
jgi:hypothetical protein